MNGKYRNWCFTSYISDIKIDCEKVNYYVYQKEICPSSKKEHIQGYIELKVQMRMNEVKKILNDEKVHLEPRFGTQEQAIKYCSKEDTRKKDCLPVYWGIPKKQGNRSELDSLCDSIESGMTCKEILLEHRGIALKHINMIAKGLKVFHECDALDRLIKCNRELENEADASEVAGNTEPAKIEAMKKEHKDLEDLELEKDLKRIRNWRV